MWIAGGNANVVRDNHIYDNWRRGVMLFQVPDNIACDLDTPHADLLPRAVPGADKLASQPVLRQHHGGRAGGKRMPNGVDFLVGQSDT